MKRITILLSVFALVMGLSQCRKPSFSALNGGETQHVVLNASWDNGGPKIDQNGMNLKWTLGDKVTVRQGGNSIGTLECKDVTKGIFEGYIMKTTGNITFTFGSNDYKDDGDFMNQTGASLNGAVYLTSGECEYREDGNYGEVPMTMPHAVLKLDLSAFGTTEGITVTIKVVGGEAVASVSGVKNDETSKALYVAVPAPNPFGTSSENLESSQYEFESSVGIARCNGWALVENTFYTLKNGDGAAIVVEPQAPAAKFTVGKDGDTPRRVEFSPGNLYWDGSVFRFEANQWSSTNTWNASHVSHFFWSNTKDWQTTNKEPYAASYSFSAQTKSDVFFTEASGFKVNGESGWRTLSKDEWAYLLNTSGASSGARTDANRFAKAVVNDVKGLLIFPDGYNGGTAIGTITGVAAVNSTDAAFPSKNIPTETWASMESVGVVFLPAAGYRKGTTMKNFGSLGFYWSSTPDGGKEDIACGMYFDLSSVYTNDDSRYDGYAVRLVR